MTAKALRNAALRTKFVVGDVVRVPRDVWTRMTCKMVNLPNVEHVVDRVGDRVIEHGKNRLCRFCIVLGGGTTSLMTGQLIWEEWMLEKIKVVGPSLDRSKDTAHESEIDGLGSSAGQDATFCSQS